MPVDKGPLDSSIPQLVERQDKREEQVVESVFDDPPQGIEQSAPASSSHGNSQNQSRAVFESHPEEGTEPSTYGPIRRKVPSKSGPLT